MVFNTGAALLDAIVLAVVSKEPEGTYGYKITQDVRGVLDISESTLYPALRRYYSLSVALTVSPECQLARLRRRESPESLKRFQALWIPMEQAYAKGTDLFHAADLCYSCDDTTENEKEP